MCLCACEEEDEGEKEQHYCTDSSPVISIPGRGQSALRAVTFLIPQTCCLEEMSLFQCLSASSCAVRQTSWLNNPLDTRHDMNDDVVVINKGRCQFPSFQDDVEMQLSKEADEFIIANAKIKTQTIKKLLHYSSVFYTTGRMRKSFNPEAEQMKSNKPYLVWVKELHLKVDKTYHTLS